MLIPSKRLEVVSGTYTTVAFNFSLTLKLRLCDAVPKEGMKVKKFTRELIGRSFSELKLAEVIWKQQSYTST